MEITEGKLDSGEDLQCLTGCFFSGYILINAVSFCVVSYVLRSHLLASCQAVHQVWDGPC